MLTSIIVKGQELSKLIPQDSNIVVQFNVKEIKNFIQADDIKNKESVKEFERKFYREISSKINRDSIRLFDLHSLGLSSDDDVYFYLKDTDPVLYTVAAFKIKDSSLVYNNIDAFYAEQNEHYSIN